MAGLYVTQQDPNDIADIEGVTFWVGKSPGNQILSLQPVYREIKDRYGHGGLYCGVVVLTER
jgi:hypothetical protein